MFASFELKTWMVCKMNVDLNKILSESESKLTYTGEYWSTECRVLMQCKEIFTSYRNIHRCTGRRVRRALDPPKIRADTTFIRAKDNTFVWLTVSPNGTSIHLREINFGWGNKGDDLHQVLLYDRKKIGSAIVHYYIFSLAGPRDKQFMFAIRAKLGLTPGLWKHHPKNLYHCIRIGFFVLNQRRIICDLIKNANTTYSLMADILKQTLKMLWQWNWKELRKVKWVRTLDSQTEESEMSKKLRLTNWEKRDD